MDLQINFFIFEILQKNPQTLEELKANTEREKLYIFQTYIQKYIILQKNPHTLANIEREKLDIFQTYIQKYIILQKNPYTPEELKADTEKDILNISDQPL